MRFICEYINARILLSIDGCLVDRGLSFCLFSFGHCIVCPSTIYGFWLPLWYLQTFLTLYICFHLSLSLSPIVFYSSFFFLCLLPCLFWIISWLYTLFYLHHYYYYFHHSMFSLRLLRRRSLSRGGGDGFPLTSLIPPHVCVYPKPGSGFQMPCVVVACVVIFLDEWWLFVLLTLVELLTITV